MGRKKEVASWPGSDGIAGVERNPEDVVIIVKPGKVLIGTVLGISPWDKALTDVDGIKVCASTCLVEVL